MSDSEINNLNNQLKKALDKKETYMIIPFLEKGASAEISNEEGNCPIHLAILNYDLNLLKYMIENKANLNVQNRLTKRTALMMAVQEKEERFIELLIKAGADLDIVDGYKETVLHVAVRQSNEALVGLLMKRGANLDIQNDKGWTALMIAVRRNNKKIFSALLEKGADIHLKDKNGWQAISWAADLGHTTLTKLLLDAGADIDCVDEKGRTPLMRAVKNDYVETVFLLLMKGAKVQIKDIYGKTALDYAVERGCQESQKLLQLAGKNEDRKEKEALPQEIKEPETVFVSQDEKIFMTVKGEEKKKLYQLVQMDKKFYLTPVFVQNQSILKKKLKEVFLFNLKREKGE